MSAGKIRIKHRISDARSFLKKNGGSELITEPPLQKTVLLKMNFLYDLDDDDLFLKTANALVISIASSSKIAGIMTFHARNFAVNSNQQYDDAYYQLVFELVFAVAGLVLR